MAVALDYLQALYCATHDPWGFETSSYEQDKFRATRDALSRPHYRAVFELGCGNGQLARHLAGICDHYTGMDAVEKALKAARKAVPGATFLKGFYPCPLPERAFDLIILSEILYFLDPEGIETLAFDILARWPEAEILCVCWLGPTQHELQGKEALALFRQHLTTHDFDTVRDTGRYRIDRALPRRHR